MSHSSKFSNLNRVLWEHPKFVVWVPRLVTDVCNGGILVSLILTPCIERQNWTELLDTQLVNWLIWGEAHTFGVKSVGIRDCSEWHVSILCATLTVVDTFCMSAWKWFLVFSDSHKTALLVHEGSWNDQHIITTNKLLSVVLVYRSSCCKYMYHSKMPFTPQKYTVFDIFN